MGLIPLTWVFYHNLVKIHLVVNETFSVLFLETAGGDHLLVPSCKKSNGLMQRLLVLEISSFSCLYFK